MFIDDNFLLDNATAERLYQEHAANCKIIDYHSHLSPKQIADKHHFHDLTEAWLEGDHYKWRAMRANGIDEKYITGDSPAIEKFRKWAQTVPQTIRNPLFHWTHLELLRYFQISDLLNENSADHIFNRTKEMLSDADFSTTGLLNKMNVELVCTTDDPCDSLEYHSNIGSDQSNLKVLPTFRPDRFLKIGTEGFIDSLEQLKSLSGVEIKDFDSMMEALERRIDFFHKLGGRLADNGIGQFPFSGGRVDGIIQKKLNGAVINEKDEEAFQSAVLIELGKLYHARGWVQQFHIGALRNANERLFNKLGPDIGCDSIGDYPVAKALSQFLSQLDKVGSLPKTILYNLNPGDNALLATMAANFNDGSVAGKMQFGASWWFLDQKRGIEQQLNDLSDFGLLPRFVGMLTDSRSFLSFPRHEYFRRILCNLLGRDIENGLLPNDLDWIGQVVQNICYRNAKNYFGFE